MLYALSVAFGAIVGFSLGLTGGGGSIFAVPLLVYGLSVEPKQAVGISLAAVGATALVGAIGRYRGGEVEVGTGVLFAAAGMVGAPLGSWIASAIPGSLLLLLFAGLMLIVATRMWWTASKSPEDSRAVRAASGAEAGPGPTCRRDPSGKLHMTSKCAIALSLVGLTTGVLAGLFGVGGGFVIVPALVLFTGMGIHRAVATSLLVIALISVSGVGSYLVSGRPLSLETTALFVVGGVLGLWFGAKLAGRLSGPRLQKVFAGAIVAVAVFIAIRNIFFGGSA